MKVKLLMSIFIGSLTDKSNKGIRRSPSRGTPNLGNITFSLPLKMEDIDKRLVDVKICVSTGVLSGP